MGKVAVEGGKPCLLANRCRAANLCVCRVLLLVVAVAAPLAAAARAAAEPESACPHCGGLIWLIVARTERPRVAEVCALSLAVLVPFDTR